MTDRKPPAASGQQQQATAYIAMLTRALGISTERPTNNIAVSTVSH